MIVMSDAAMQGTVAVSNPVNSSPIGLQDHQNVVPIQLRGAPITR
jgi:hypothetical protein